MKKTFRNKTMGFLGVFLMSMMLVIASGAYPNPFVSDNEANVAIVYGASAAGTDVTAADSIVNSLASGIITEEDLDRILSAGVTEDEVILGSVLPFGKIKATLTDNQIPSLFDGKIEWYDGDNTDSYNVHEELIINGLVVKTTLNNNEFEGVVLTNDRALEYKYVFEETIFDNYNDLDNDDADMLEITILGKEYVIEEVTDTSITMTNAEEGIFEIGDTIVVKGVTLTVNDIYDEAISVNGIFIDENKKKTINGVQVKVETVYYKDSTTLPSKVRLYYGGEISEEYDNGDAYIGEDDDDPEWVWSINEPGKAGGHIGVKYDLRQIDEEDDVAYEGDEYTFPHDFATVSFDSLTDVEYSNYEVFFDNVDLCVKTNDGTNDCSDEDSDVDVTVIQGENEDSFKLADDTETDTLYLRTVGNSTELYYMDLDEDYSTGKPVLYEDADVLEAEEALALVVANATATGDDLTLAEGILTEAMEAFYGNIATLTADETEFKVSIDGVTFFIGSIEISLGEEDSEYEDGILKAEGTSIRNEDNDVMDHYGTIIEAPESNMDDDRVVLQVPSEQVYAQISVLGSEEDSTIVVDKSTPAELGIAKITDGQIATADGKNVIVVGGSCINSLAAELLGGKACGVEFTAKTGVNAGQVLIQTFDRGNGNIATVVAGYNAADTQRGVAELLKGNINIAVGEKVII